MFLGSTCIHFPFHFSFMFLVLLIPFYATPPDRISFIHADKITLKLYRILNISCTDRETKVQPNPGMFSILWIIMSSKPFFFKVVWCLSARNLVAIMNKNMFTFLVFFEPIIAVCWRQISDFPWFRRLFRNRPEGNLKSPQCVNINVIFLESPLVRFNK